MSTASANAVGYTPHRFPIDSLTRQRLTLRSYETMLKLPNLPERERFEYEKLAARVRKAIRKNERRLNRR